MKTRSMLSFVGLVSAACLFTADKPAVADEASRAFLVGLESYGAGHNLRYAVDDVDALGTELRKIGFETETIRDEKLTARQILARFNSFLSRCPEGSTVFVAFCCHGGYDEQKKDNILFPLDRSSDKTMEVLYVDSLYTALSESRNIGQKIVVFDACRGEGDGATSATDGVVQSTAGTTRFYTSRAPITSSGKSYSGSFRSEVKNTPPKNSMLMFSTESGKPSYEVEEIKHGVFMNQLIKAFYHKVGEQKEGKNLRKIKLSDVFADVHKETLSYTINFSRGQQKPQYDGGENDIVDFLIGRGGETFTDIVPADWRFKDLSQIDLRYAVFQNCDLSGLNLSGLDFTGARFVKTKLVGTNFRGAKLPEVTFDQADCQQANFESARLPAAKARYSNFNYATFIKCAALGFRAEYSTFHNIRGPDPRGSAK